ncbi:MAG: DNA alkylation repair protein [Fibrobacter sp.]|nr:DNA alkylation repair protein [Fibrobacter sp.]
MTHAELVKKLFENQDLKYREFHTSLVPGIPHETYIGVRVPVLRTLAKEFASSATPAEFSKFMDSVPHKYFEENHIHTMLMSSIKDFDECLARTEQFLPYINNWAICDGKKPKALLKDEPRFLKHIAEWVKSDHPYVVRFGINMLMDLFLDDRFDPKFLKWVAAVDTAKFRSLPDGSLNKRVAAVTPAGVPLANPEYYVQMEVAWYFATALAKQWDDAVPYIEKRKLDPWTHNKAIQKSIESFRVTDEHKAYLRTLKV